MTLIYYALRARARKVNNYFINEFSHLNLSVQFHKCICGNAISNLYNMMQSFFNVEYFVKVILESNVI